MVHGLCVSLPRCSSGVWLSYSFMTTQLFLILVPGLPLLNPRLVYMLQVTTEQLLSLVAINNDRGPHHLHSRLACFPPPTQPISVLPTTYTADQRPHQRYPNTERRVTVKASTCISFIYRRWREFFHRMFHVIGYLDLLHIYAY